MASIGRIIVFSWSDSKESSQSTEISGSVLALNVCLKALPSFIFLSMKPEEKLQYIPFSRKYRPTKLAELVGQEVLIRILTHAIQYAKLAHAYLLTGIRGTGKTSAARIIAKTVNCTQRKLVELYIEPCNQCQNCQSFNKSNHPDVVEIDAASRTGVDDIREIIESAEYRPLLGEQKFFIIDEVHMLSKNAFNALLKIIEEPPKHVTFIFATTEVHKIPLTIISRCQRYDLRRLNCDETYKLLQTIAYLEKLQYAPEALKMIVSRSEGSARDAVSLLDQVVSYAYCTKAITAETATGNVITATLASDVLGVVSISTIVEFVQMIIANDTSKTLEKLNEIYRCMHSLQYFMQSIAEFIVELAKMKIIANYSSPRYVEYKDDMENLLIGTPLSRLSILWQIFSNGLLEMKQSHNELATAEMLVIKAIYACNLPDVDKILASSTESKDANTIVNNHLTAENMLADEQKSTVGGAAAQILSPVMPDNSANHSTKHITVVEEELLFDFLRYCHQQDWAVYYALLNEVEVQRFTAGVVWLGGNITAELVQAIKAILSAWHQDWQLTIQQQDRIVTLKEKLLEQVRAYEDYNVIKKYFPRANISDIILNSTTNSR